MHQIEDSLTILQPIVTTEHLHKSYSRVYQEVLPHCFEMQL